MAVVNAALANKTVSDPNAEYESLRPLWQKSRAICSGERFTKDFDSYLDVGNFTNLLIPFSPSMTAQQYQFYKAEAELPGIVAQFAKMLVGGLLRKQPVLSLPPGIPEEVQDWIMNQFGQDDSSLIGFLDAALWEELQTSRAWIYVDHPVVDPDTLSVEDKQLLKPYPVLWQADSVINWRTRKDPFGKMILDRVIVRSYEESFEKNEFHPSFKDTVRVHELDESGFYQIRVFQQRSDTTSVQVVNGQQQKEFSNRKPSFELVETIQNILNNGERLRIIPAWPLNGSVNLLEPILMPIIDKEVSLYNKISRRNHLLYGASTYTPVIMSDMNDDEFEEVVNKGLGSWLRLRQGDEAKVLETPTAALQDMDRAIAAAIEEMAKLGIRMLSPESAQSGIALEIRNAAQNAQLGSLNTKISSTLRAVICFMINWRYNLQLRPQDINFSLSSDFNPIPLGADWLRLATEWYQQGLIPRSIWLMILKQNDMIPPDYDDEEGKMEITADMEAVMKAQQGSSDYASKIANTEGL
jgi:hypothetical protein